MNVEIVGTVNGYTICRATTSSYFVQWMAGEYATQEDAEAAARMGELYDYADSPTENDLDFDSGRWDAA